MGSCAARAPKEVPVSINDIDTLPVEQKLRLMEALWDSLLQTPAALEGGTQFAWHAQALQRAETALADGSARFIDWDAAKLVLGSRSRA